MQEAQYVPDLCGHCNQTTSYVLAIDKGVAHLMIVLSDAIEKKGVNFIHPRKEIEPTGKLTSNQVGNLSRPRFHGLIASVGEKKGYYCITKKGFDFLKGGSIPRWAIISKTDGQQIGYWNPEEQVTIRELLKKDLYWEGIDYEVEDGQVIQKL